MRFEKLSAQIFLSESDLLRFFKEIFENDSVEDIEYILDIEYAFENGIFPSDVDNEEEDDEFIIDYESFRKKTPSNSEVLGLPRKYPVTLFYEFIDDHFIARYAYYDNIVAARKSIKE